MLKAFIFDLDGTLMDSEILWVRATDDFLRDRNCPITHEDIESIVYGRSWRMVHHLIVERFPELSMDVKEMEVALHPYYLKARGNTNICITESVALLKKLSRHFPVCIVSGACRLDVDEAVRIMDIADQLAFSMASEDYQRSKPDPECFQMAARRLGVSNQECLVFEDSTVGVAGAKRCGMHCVALSMPNRPAQDISPADLVLNNLADFSLEKFNLNLTCKSIDECADPDYEPA